jgi:hypothetical protein
MRRENEKLTQTLLAMIRGPKLAIGNRKRLLLLLQMAGNGGQLAKQMNSMDIVEK